MGTLLRDTILCLSALGIIREGEGTSYTESTFINRISHCPWKRSEQLLGVFPCERNDLNRKH